MLKFGVNILQMMRATIMRHRAVWVSKPLCLLSVITRQVTMGFNPSLTGKIIFHKFSRYFV